MKKQRTPQNEIEENMTTLSFRYHCINPNDYTIINDLRKTQTSQTLCVYNKLHDIYPETLKTAEITEFQKSLNNLHLESHLMNCAAQKAKTMLSQDITRLQTYNESPKIKKWNKKKKKYYILIPKKKLSKQCIGGKDTYSRYRKGLISKDELIKERLLPLYSRGEVNYNGNRRFQFIDKNNIMLNFTDFGNIKIKLEDYKNYSDMIQKLIYIQNIDNKKDNRKLPLTFTLDENEIHISFDLSRLLKLTKYKPIKNRYLAIDMNPNFLGYSVNDWKDEFNYSLVDTGVLSIESINKFDDSLKGKGLDSSSKQRVYISDKRNYEIEQIAIRLVNISKHYQCEAFVIEELSFKRNKDDELSHNTKRLIYRQWCRIRLIEMIKKHCRLNKIRFMEVKPEYSSIIGNLVYRKEKLPDMVLASIEIGRRGYEFTSQYLRKEKETKSNIRKIDINLVRSHIVQSLEELNYQGEIKSWSGISWALKNLKLRYRVPLESIDSEVFRLNSRKSLVDFYEFKSSWDSSNIKLYYFRQLGYFKVALK